MRQGIRTEIWLAKFRRKPPLGIARKKLSGDIRGRRELGPKGVGRLF
jgi:hypothetical protein